MVSQTKSRKIPTRKVLPLFFASRCDTGCDHALNDFAVAGLEKGAVSMSTVDRALERVYQSSVALGTMDGFAKVCVRRCEPLNFA